MTLKLPSGIWPLICGHLHKKFPNITELRENCGAASHTAGIYLGNRKTVKPTAANLWFSFRASSYKRLSTATVKQ